MRKTSGISKETAWERATYWLVILPTMAWYSGTGVLVAFPLGVVHQLAEHLPGLLLQGDKVVEGLGALAQAAGVASS